MKHRAPRSAGHKKFRAVRALRQAAERYKDARIARPSRQPGLDTRPSQR